MTTGVLIGLIIFCIGLLCMLVSTIFIVYNKFEFDVNMNIFFISGVVTIFASLFLLIFNYITT